MEKASQPYESIFNRLGRQRPDGDGSSNIGHLRPLSVYARMITSELDLSTGNPSADLPWMSSNPLFKIEIANVSTGRKRRLDDSCLDDDSFETPFKKPCCIPKSVSPDLGCVIDSCDPLPDIDTASSATVPRTVSPNDSELLQSRNNEEADGREKGVVPRGCSPTEVQDSPETSESNPDNVTLDLGPVFDVDVDSIMCLSPIDSNSDSDEGVDAYIQSCDRFRALGGSLKPRDSHQDNPSPGQSPSKAQGARKVEEKEQGEEVEEGREGELEGKEVTGKQDEGLNNGSYFSRSYLEALRVGKGVSEAETPLLPQATSSPFVREREVTQGPQAGLSEGVEEKQTLCVGEVSSIGAPLLESSVCIASEAPGVFDGEKGEGEGEESTLSSVHGCEESSYEYETTLSLLTTPAETPLLPQATSSPFVREREVTQGPQAGLSEGVEEKQTLCRPEPNKGQALVFQTHFSCLDDLSCTLLGAPLFPLEGSVDGLEGTAGEVSSIGAPLLESSVCIASEAPGVFDGEKGEGEGEESTLSSVHGCEESSYETTLPLQVQVRSVVVVPSNPKTLQKTAPRPVVFDSKDKWWRQKCVYMDSVTRHMEEHTVGGHGVMSELRSLMTHVADQGPGTYGRQWQHPSDLTCRNYRSRFGNETPLFSLDDWQNQNHLNHRRFS